MSKQLSGKTAIVTGASSGVGRAIACQLARAGATVYLMGRSAQRLDAVKAEIEAAGGIAVACPSDLRDLRQIDAVVERAVVETGALNIMVSNAGLEHGLLTPIAEGDPEQWREMFDVNVLAVLKGAQAAILAMRKGGFAGHIVNVGSVAGRDGGSGVYGATKAAVNYIGTELRRELEADPIRVVQILPGTVFTNFGRNMPPQFVNGMLQALKIDGEFTPGEALSDDVIAQTQSAAPTFFLSADDVARAVVFAVSQPITVDIFEIDIRPQSSSLPR